MPPRIWFAFGIVIVVCGIPCSAAKNELLRFPCWRFWPRARVYQQLDVAVALFYPKVGTRIREKTSINLSEPSVCSFRRNTNTKYSIRGHKGVYLSRFSVLIQRTHR